MHIILELIFLALLVTVPDSTVEGNFDYVRFVSQSFVLDQQYF